MDAQEKRKQYYINNRDKILEKSKQYYHDNKEERQKCRCRHGRQFV